MQRPIFMLVSGDARRLDALRHDLSRRYEADYQVCVASSAAAALTMLAVLAGARAEVALVIADEYLADMPAVDFLARAHSLHAGAKRILLIYHGDWSPEHPAVLAIAVGKIDYHLYAPWYPLTFSR
jgi:thioredoxin reductase (NADPH)